MIIGILLFALILFGVSYIISVLLKDNRKEDEYIEPNEYMTLKDCLDLYYYEDKRVVIEDGKITDIVNR